MSKYAAITILLFFLTAPAISGYGQLSADFTADTTRGCAPLVIKFQDASSGNPTSWRWEMGDGTALFVKDPATTYFNPGSYTVKLVVSNASKTDSVIKTALIEVYAPPVVNFDASRTTGCFPLEVQFSDLSTPQSGTIVSWEWDFGDGFSSTESNPVHIYKTLGNYNVTLRIRNSNGCITTLGRSNYIRISTGVDADFGFETPANCRPPTPVQFNSVGGGTGLLTYQWDFGDGGTEVSPNPVHSYTQAGVYTVRLIATNDFGCSSEVIKTNLITIGEVKAGFISPASICVGADFKPVNNSNPIPSGALWNFGDGSGSTAIEPVHQYAIPGDYQVKLVSDFGACKDSVTVPVKVLPRPQADFSAANTAICKPPLAVSFSANATDAVSYKWYFGDGDSSSAENPSHTYTTYGEFSVTLAVTNAAGCTNIIVKDSFVVVKQPVVSLQNGAQGCAPLRFEPRLNVNSTDELVSYLWDFGEGHTSTEKEPSNIYSNPGLYDVKLSYTTAGGCSGEFTALAAVQTGLKPTAAFMALPQIACAYGPIGFVDTSSGAPVDQWYWEFGDGGTSTAPAPEHFYQDTGYFSIRLVVWSNGCPDTLDVADYIRINPPIARFSDSSGCGTPYARKFTDRSIGASSWFWEFGDGATSTERHPEHTYAAKGSYTVKLTVSNDTCEHNASLQVVIVSEKADFAAGETTICKNVPASFNTTGITEGNIIGYNWDFGDGWTQGGPSNATHTYSESGIYDVQLVITDVSGCQDTLRKPLYIKVEGPSAGFSTVPLTVCTNTPIVFSDTSSADPQQPIVSWIWDYGDGATETLTAPPFTHSYQNAGDYTVQLTVVDGKGCRDQASHNSGISISKPKPVFESPDSLSCTGKTVRFINRSQGSISSYFWSFGDGQTSDDAQPSHTYANEGAYSVKLVAVDIFGCTDSLVKADFIVIRDPKAALTVSDSVATCPPLVVNFTNNSQHYNRLQWYFGDETNSAIENPSHFYTRPGSYPARLVITSAGGCMDSVTQIIVVRGPEGNFTYDVISGCEPMTINFKGITKDNANFVWDFNDGSVISDDSIIVHTYERRGVYLPKMILVDPQGCRVPIPGADTLKVYGIDAALRSDDQILCDSGLVNFTNISVANEEITSHRWFFGDGAESLSRNPSHFYRAPGTYPVMLIAATRTGCIDTTRADVPVRVSETPVVAINGDEGACIPATLQFIGEVIRKDTSELNWVWDFGNGQSSRIQSPPSMVYPEAGAFTIRLTGTNSSGCAGIAEKMINAYPLPPIDAGPDQVICRENLTDLSATGALTYQWIVTPDISCTDCAAPKIHPLTNATYYVTGTNEFTCTAVDSVKIEVKQPIELVWNRGDTLCLGESIPFNATGAELYAWSPSTGLSNASIANPIATPSSSIVYRVIGYDDHQCFSDTGYVPVVVYPYPSVNVGEDRNIAVGSSVPLNATLSADVTSLTWRPSVGLSCLRCKDPVANPKKTTEYSLEVINEGGCLTRDELTIFVFCDNGNFFLPNTFSPNADGVNDVFYPRGNGVFSIKTLRIFNRWGEVVFEKTDFNPNDAQKGWDGQYNKRPAPQDVYVYSIDLICENQVILNYKGNVALIR